MGRFRSRSLCWAAALSSLLGISGCGGTKAGPPLFAGHITVTPGSPTSMVLGNTLGFIASVSSSSGTILRTTITFSSSDTSILNMSPAGIACAGRWDNTFSICTPGNVGLALVTASALGGVSVPTYVFVHPQVDTITVTGVLLNNLPVQEPCLSQSQSMTLEAHAFSRGTDVTQSVGPFSWSASNPTVATMIPLVNTTYKFPTNQLTAVALTPGITYIYASAGGVTSTAFQQPQYSNSAGGTSPPLDFFATCPIENVSLEIGAAGSGQTSFNITKSSTAENVVATLTDIMGNSSLPNTNSGVVLSAIPLVWSSSQPQVINVSNSCRQNCNLTISSAGSASITAACSPPSCNLGFPIVPQSLSTPAQIQACTTFFQAQFPQFAGCDELIPVPVYSSSVFFDPNNPTAPPISLSPNAAISGVVSGSPATTSVFAASMGCADQPPSVCLSSVYFPSTAKASPGNQFQLPVSPNSFLFDPQGIHVYMGSDFGAETITPTNFGTSSSPFGALGTVTGRVLAVSNSGTAALFSDTVHSPNQVYVVNTAGAGSASATALSIPSATVAAFSPDGLKTFIAAGAGGESLYIYSPLQALQQPSAATPQLSLSGPTKGIGFAPNGAFAFLAEASGASSANLTAFASCNNQIAASVSLPADPILMRVLPNVHIDGRDSYGNTIPDGIHIAILDSTGIDIITATVSQPTSGVCPQGLTFKSGDPSRPVQRVELGQGTLHPLNFFVSGDGTQIYVVNSNSSTIVAYNFIAGALVGGIELLNSATPLSADMTVDGGTILVSGSDGMLHELSTALGGADLVQLSFPNLPNYFNAFCTFTPSPGPCTLDTALAK